MWSSQKVVFLLGNCDIDFFNFRQQKVHNFEISDLFKRNRNFAFIFWKYAKRNQKSTKYFKTSQKPRIIPLKFCEMLLVSWNFTNYCKITQFLVKLCKTLKDLRKILLVKKSNIALILLNFVHALKNGRKLANFSL